MKLSREQLRIVNQINTEARNVPKPLRQKFKVAAYETGLVESHLTNPHYGDATSEGWRQEQTTFYKDPTNVKHSVRRFRQEFLQQYDPGERAGDVAAQVQRPRADLRGRYQAARPQAIDILKRYGGSSPAGGTSSQTRTVTTPGVDNSAARQKLLQQYVLTRNDPNALLGLAQGLQGAQDVPGSSKTVRVKTSANDKTADGAVGLLKQEAMKIDKAHVPYLWGGGHQSKQKRGSKVTPLDCSGAVSRVLGINPMVASQFASWGKSGQGKRVTIWAAKDGSHVLMELDGHFFGTSHQNKGGGAGWIPRSYLGKGYLSNFVARHPAGM